MPTLKRFGAISVRMYADHHNPPHFHVVGPDFQVLLRIADFGVMAGEAKPSDLAEVRDWASAHQGELAAKWAELNERM